MANMIPWLSLPPLSALRAFAAFAETGSVTAAGARIGVTHAAVSQQLRTLERHLGVALLRREARGLVLTAEGQLLANAVADGFGTIARSCAALTQQHEARALTITTTPSFAAGWLMPRLADFRARNPGIDIVIDPTPDMREIGPAGADAALRYGNGNWPGLEARLVLRSSVVVVAAPSLVGTRPGNDLGRLADLPWLQELGTTEATEFLRRHDVTRDHGQGLLSLPGNLVLDAVRNGQGVAAIARAFVEADLAAGRLRLMYEDSEREGYFLVTRPGPHRAAVKSFATWVLRQAATV